MEILLLIVGITFLGLLLLRPARQTQVIYVPVTVEEPQGGGLGCLPLIIIIVAILILLVLGGIQL